MSVSLDSTTTRRQAIKAARSSCTNPAHQDTGLSFKTESVE